jgi:hypothetical protein
MESDMDRQDFEVTAREAFEYIEQAIERLALDGVEAYPLENGLKLMLENGLSCEFLRNDEAMHIDARFPQGAETLYWDAVEEQWYTRTNEKPLPAVLGDVLTNCLSRPVNLTDIE